MLEAVLWCLIFLSLYSSLRSSHAFQSSTPIRQQNGSFRRSVRLLQSVGEEDIYAAVHRKEYEMKQFKSQHTSTTDPVRMAMSYAQVPSSMSSSSSSEEEDDDDAPQSSSSNTMRLAKALRRVYDDPYNSANPHSAEKTAAQRKRSQQLADIGMADLGMRRASLIVDIKRKSRGGKALCNFDDAGMVAEAMVRLGADAVFVNTDYTSYGGDITELKSAVQAVRRISDTAAVVMKDIVVDEIQLGVAKEAGADGIVLMSCVLGPALSNFLDLATMIGLETIVECHTRNEVQQALDLMAQNILVNNYDRVRQQYYPQQAIQLAGMFPGSGGPVICLATGGLETTDHMKRHLAVGYDGVVVGRACMGSPKAPEFIRAVRDRTLLPAEMSQWGIDAEFDIDGNLMVGPKRNVPNPDDVDVYQ